VYNDSKEKSRGRLRKMAKVYSPKDISDLLQVKESTLRKYSLMLEDVGYTFQKNDRGQRWYSDEDVIALKKIVAFKNDGAMNLKQSVEAVYMWAKEKDVALPSTDTESDAQRYNPDIADLKMMVVEQGKQIEELKELVLQQNRYINERMEDRDRKLMESLREVQETKRLIAAEQEKKQEEENKPWWGKIFKK
jgi:DNA-binding transcriptional MerR regulator